MAWSNCSLRELEAQLPAYAMVKDKIELSSSREEVQKLLREKIDIFEIQNKDQIQEIDTRDGYKIVLLEKAWIHIRPSNTEPIIRVIAEAQTEAYAQELIAQFKTILR